MILADTSLWIDHLRRGHPALARELRQGRIATHPFVIGEIACGNLRHRQRILDLLHALPTVEMVDHDRVMTFVNDRGLMGCGLGWVDMHLLIAAITSGTKLATQDKVLAHTAAEHDVAAGL